MTTAPARGDAAKAALVEQAERLFAEHGIAGVSLRDVSAAAGQRNHSAAQYHFGDREGLVVAVYRSRMAIVDERRRRRLAALEAAGALDDLAGVMEALLVPLLEVVAETDGWYGRFLTRTRWDPSAWDAIERLDTAGSLRLSVRHLARLLDHLPAPIRRSRLDQLLTLVLGTVAGWEGAPDRGEPRMAVEALATDLVVTAVALLTAPVRTEHLSLQGATP